ncbi:DUF6445 family protein [Streptomyces sp. NPDC002680]|uniref:DUF6445 family protein n=1 Tax=Streptomyces sp. NPDC002680 TaxID=3364659 RepID=UPI0036ABEA8F
MSSKVIIVDDFYANPEAVRAKALTSRFANIEPTDYPGFASQLVIGSRSLEQVFTGLIGAELNVDRDRFTWGGFRYITEKSGRSAIVHADVAADWAGMVYLTPNAPMSSGTAFFRHRATGLSSPPTDREARAMGYADSSEFDDQVIRPDKADLSKWEQIARIGPVYNRLILFRGSEHYHAPMGGCGDCAKTARLTHIFFVNELPPLGAVAHEVTAA